MSSFLPPTFSFQALSHRHWGGRGGNTEKKQSTFPSAFFSQLIATPWHQLQVTASQLNQSSTVSKIKASLSLSNQRDLMQRSKGETDTSLIGQGGICL